jgi:hypothetical protein
MSPAIPCRHLKNLTGAPARISGALDEVDGVKPPSDMAEAEALSPRG